MGDLPDEVRALLRDIVHQAVDTGAECQRLGSFTIADPGIPVRSIHDVLTDRAIARMLMVWPVHVDTFLQPKPGEAEDASDG